MAYFQEQLRGFLTDYLPVGAITSRAISAAIEKKPELRPTSIKKMMRGEIVRAAAFRQINNAFGMLPLDWIEAKARYAETYLQSYLVQPVSDLSIQEFGRLDSAHFFEPRREYPNPQWGERLAKFFNKCFRERETTAQSIATGRGRRGNKNHFVVSRQTVNALLRGEQIRPEKFLLICQRLQMDESLKSTAKILYAENLLGEFLLGSDERIFKKIDSEGVRERYSRTINLLVHSIRRGKNNLH